MMIKHKGILQENFKIQMSSIFAFQTQKSVNKVSVGQEGT